MHLDLDIVLFLGGGFVTDATAARNLDYMRIGRLVAIIIINTGMSVPVCSRPIAEFLLLGCVSAVTVDDFPAGADKDTAKQVCVIITCPACLSTCLFKYNIYLVNYLY